MEAASSIIDPNDNAADRARHERLRQKEELKKEVEKEAAKLVEARQLAAESVRQPGESYADAVRIGVTRQTDVEMKKIEQEMPFGLSKDVKEPEEQKVQNRPAPVVHEKLEETRADAHAAVDRAAAKVEQEVVPTVARTVETVAQGAKTVVDTTVDVAHAAASTLAHPGPKAEVAATVADAHTTVAKTKLSEGTSALGDAAYHAAVAAEESAKWALHKSNEVIQDSLAKARDSVLGTAKSVAQWVEEKASSAQESVDRSREDSERVEAHMRRQELAKAAVVPEDAETDRERFMQRRQRLLDDSDYARKVEELQRINDAKMEEISRENDEEIAFTSSVVRPVAELPLPSVPVISDQPASIVERAVERLRHAMHLHDETKPTVDATGATVPQSAAVSSTVPPASSDEGTGMRYDTIGDATDDFFEAGRIIGDAAIRKIKDTLRALRGSIDEGEREVQQEIFPTQTSTPMSSITVPLPPAFPITTHVPITEEEERVPITTTTSRTTVPTVPVLPVVTAPPSAAAVVASLPSAVGVASLRPEELLSSMDERERVQFVETYKHQLDEAFDSIKASMGINEKDILNDDLPAQSYEASKTLREIGHYFAEAKNNIDHVASSSRPLRRQ